MASGTRASRYWFGATLALLVAFAGCDAQSGLDSIAGRSVPGVASAKSLSAHYVEVSFSGKAGSDAASPARYDIRDAEGRRLDVSAVELVDNNSKALLTTATQDVIPYSLRVDRTPTGVGGVTETNVPEVQFAGDNGPEPCILYAVALTNTSVLLTFDLVMEAATTQVKDYYEILPDLKINSAVLDPAAKRTVVLNTASMLNTDYNVRITNVRSGPSAYYLIDPVCNNAAFNGIPPLDNVAPKLVKAEVKGYEEILLTFNEPLGHHADDVANYSISPPLPVVAAIPNEWGTQVTLRVLPLTAGVNNTVTVVDVEDRSANVIDPTANSANFMIPADEAIKPQIVSAVALDCQTILVTFSEPMADNAGDPANYSVDPALAIISAQLSDFKTQVLFTTQPLQSNVEYTMTAQNLEDSVGNPIDPAADEATFECQAGANTDALGPLPRIVGAFSMNNTTVIVGYDRPMGDSAIVPSNYFIVQTEVNPEVGTLAISDAEFPGDDRTLVQLTTSSQNEVTYQVSAIGVRDEQGNPLAPKIGFNGLILVDPSSAIFPGTPPGAAELVDTDEDGILDNEELRGRTIVITLLNGEKVERQVTSSPFLGDTDDDGLDDYTERTLNTNPRDPDTDGDVLTDEREFNLFYCDPTKQDSDGDGTDDGLEVNFFKTAPLLADTDGDGFDDGKELYELSRNPNLADLPRPNIKADNIRLLINEKYSFTDSTGQTVSTSSSSQTTLTQSNETKFSTSDTDVLKVGAEVSLEISASPSLTIGGSFGAEWTTQTTTESSQSAQQQYQNSISKSREISTTRQVTREIVGASVSATVTIVNEGDIAFTIGNIEVSALQQGGPNRSKFIPIATLVPSGGNNSFNLGPLIPERGPFIFSNTDVFPNLVEDLMRAPRGLVLKVANFDMTDEFGRNFAFTSQEVNDRTAAINIDFGDGRVERFRVATYGGLDDAGYGGPAGDFVGGFSDIGETAGIPLDFALQAILKYTKNPSDPDSIVAGENGVANTVAGGDDVQEIPPGTTGLDDRAVVVSAGVNGVLNSTPASDDQEANTEGYDTSASCNEFTRERIVEPLALGDGIANTAKLLGSDDIQAIAVGTPVAPGTTIINPGVNGILDTVQQGDDIRRGPGDPCLSNAECPNGACDGREVLTRFDNSQTGSRNRFWIALTSDKLPVGTDFGNVNLQPGFVILLAFIQDIDRDGLPAQEEYVHGSNDRDKDTDDDGLGDFAEVRLGWIVDLPQAPYQAYPDPRLADSDGDGASDPAEMTAKTDPRLPDTDLDGVEDDIEITDNTSTWNSLCSGAAWQARSSDDSLEVTNLDPLNEDSDGDGLDDGRELELGTCPLDRQDGPQFLDTDEDGLTDADEATPRTIQYWACNGVFTNVPSVTTDPTNGDTDFDGLPDLLEVGSASLGVPGLGSNPRDVDTDDDGLLDFDEFRDFALFRHLSSEFPGYFLDEGSSQRIGTSPRDCDTDGDTLTDTFEHEGDWLVLAFGDESSRTVQSDPRLFDTDLDGVDDGREFRGRDNNGATPADAMDPTDPDTDGDDRTDGEELNVNSDPLRPDIHLVARVVAIRDVDSGNIDFSIRVRQPVEGITRTVMNDTRLLQGNPSIGTLVTQSCVDWWSTGTFWFNVFVPSFFQNSFEANPMSFGLPLGHPLVIEGEWKKVDSTNCPGNIVTLNCDATFSEQVDSNTLLQTGFISKTIEFNEGNCKAKVTLEITAD